MRLRSVWISEYKNLQGFSIAFEGEAFIDIFVGKNGSGKSNFLEALIEIFDHLFDFDPDETGPGFDYSISYEIDEKETSVAWRDGALTIDDSEGRKTLGQTPLPDHVLVYYSGQNPQFGELVERYDKKFQNKIDGPEFAGSPRFVPVTNRVQDLYLATMFALPEEHPGRKVLVDRLSIKTLSPDLRLTLQRPAYARNNPAQFDIDDLQGQKYWRARGATKDFLDRLEGCFHPAPDQGPIRPEGFQATDDQYILYLDINRLRAEFAEEGMCSLFRQFYSLKLLDMLVSLSAEVELTTGFKGRSTGFSDGQFQMVYLLASAELFKDRNIISLFDEPDAFLHPEWQFDFLKQIDAISDQAARTNHFLLSSHSASTIAAEAPGRIRLLARGEDGIQPVEKDKAELVKSLSAGLITFSEKEARLNIRQILKNTTGPILFTEGISDEVILEIAWEKLHPGEECPFEIQSAFSASFLSVLLTDQTLYDDNHGRKFFGIFDFDDAYNCWNIKGEEVETSPDRCLVRKRKDCEGYSMLLPVPAGLSIRDQVVNPITGQHFKAEARLTIELLFKDVPNLEEHFEVDLTRPGNCIRFKGKKTRFATRVVPALAAEHFEVLRPIFDFVLSKIAWRPSTKANQAAK